MSVDIKYIKYMKEVIKIYTMHLLSIIGYKNPEVNWKGNVIILAKLILGEFKSFRDYEEYGKLNNINTWSEEAYNEYLAHEQNSS